MQVSSSMNRDVQDELGRGLRHFSNVFGCTEKILKKFLVTASFNKTQTLDSRTQQTIAFLLPLIINYNYYTYLHYNIYILV